MKIFDKLEYSAKVYKLSQIVLIYCNYLYEPLEKKLWRFFYDVKHRIYYSHFVHFLLFLSDDCAGEAAGTSPAELVCPAVDSAAAVSAPSCDGAAYAEAAPAAVLSLFYLSCVSMPSRLGEGSYCWSLTSRKTITHVMSSTMPSSSRFHLK